MFCRKYWQEGGGVGMPFSEKKNYSTEHGTDGNCGTFRRNSVCFSERKMLGIQFRDIPPKIFGISRKIKIF
jgi:hypothetical protein